MLKVLTDVFPKVTFWEAMHRYRSSWRDTFTLDTPYTEQLKGRPGFDAFSSWGQTVEHFAKLGLDTNFIGVQLCAWSDELEEGIGSYFSEYGFYINDDEENPKPHLWEHPQLWLQMLKGLGASSSLSGVWLRQASAFAGDYVCLYEPEPPFDLFYDNMKYVNVIDEVRQVREQVRHAFTPANFAARLREVGAQVEDIGPERLFAQFGPLGQDSSRQRAAFTHNVTRALREQAG
jgi:hypothetical protein